MQRWSNSHRTSHIQPQCLTSWALHLPGNNTRCFASSFAQLPVYRWRPSRAGAVCWGLLCVLLLDGIIRLGFYQKNQLETSNNNLTTERDQLQTKLLRKRLSGLKRAGPKGWTLFQSTWYYISSEVKSWDESRKDCIERGEQTFLTNLNKRIWIGLTDKDKEGTWKWVDGTPLTTTYWMGKNPDNKMEEDCAEISIGPVEGNWDDFSCATHLNRICEQKH
uniref:C-type lectin domain-containing protein n=1 Tax=Oncorhynchus kisutch TaxID=8019 RepID=A0A8C7JEK1_ONCKI